MRSVTALSVAPDARSWLANSHRPRILHVFDRACNLINERREILSLVTPRVGNGPFNLVVEEEICFSAYLNLESAVSISVSEIKLGNLTLPLANAKLWSPKPDWEILHAHKHKITNQVAELSIANYLKIGGFNCLRLNHRNLSDPQSLVSSLSHAIANADLLASRIASRKLAGLGIGLTPSGDDFLMGAMYAAWIVHPREIACALAKEVAETAAPLTTSLSAAWLRSAGKGEAGSLWHEFFEALIASDKAKTRLQVTKLLSVGHTSGADVLAGFCRIFSFSSRLQPTGS